MSTQPAVSSFAELALSEPLQKALSDVGYETPSAIQAATIPALIEGRDVLGQAQTGTGKTAAFALPILAQLQASGKSLRFWYWHRHESWPFKWPRPFRNTHDT